MKSCIADIDDKVTKLCLFRRTLAFLSLQKDHVKAPISIKMIGRVRLLKILFLSFEAKIINEPVARKNTKVSNIKGFHSLTNKEHFENRRLTDVTGPYHKEHPSLCFPSLCSIRSLVFKHFFQPCQGKHLIFCGTGVLRRDEAKVHLNFSRVNEVIR